MVIGSTEIENKADVVSISCMVYNAEKGSSSFRHSLLVAELDQPNWERALEQWADLGPAIPIFLHFTTPFSDPGVMKVKKDQ